MPITTYVTSVDPNEAGTLQTDEKKIVSTLGPDDKAIAVQLQELFASVTAAVEESLDVESTLTVEITGSVSLKATGGVKYLFFNVGGEASTTGTMKVTLATKVSPKKPSVPTA